MYFQGIKEKQIYRSSECLIQRKNNSNYGKTLAAATERLDDYLSDYQHHFRNRTKIFHDKADIYAHGIFLSDRRNIERICEDVQGAEYFQMQHFITESNWDARSVIDQASTQISNALPKRKLTGLIVDETGTVKKGDKSVGVGWQYCGNVGKTANSQVAVMACLCNGDFASMVDARLYLPTDWSEDANRCKKAGIPEEKRGFKTKPELAYDIVKHQKELGVEFDFVGGDGLYGNDPELCDKLDQLGCIYMMDIHKDQPIFVEKPNLVVPERKGKRGKKPTLPKPDQDNIRVDKYYEQLSVNDWQRINVRNTAKGKLKAEYHLSEVFIWNKHKNCIEKRLLIIRRTETKRGYELKFSFTNANLVQYTEKAIAYMQAQRFFVEHCIKECKQVLGLSQYQTRKWLAWQHQVALNIMTACFLLLEKIFTFDDLPLLSAWDIKEWLWFKLFQQLTDEEMIDRIFLRHLKRQQDINRAFKSVAT